MGLEPTTLRFEVYGSTIEPTRTAYYPILSTSQNKYKMNFKIQSNEYHVYHSFELCSLQILFFVLLAHLYARVE